MCSPSNKQLIMNKFLAILLLLILFCSNVSGQRWISGQAIGHTGEPAKGALVYIRRTDIGTVTDSNGNFRLEVDSLHQWLYFYWRGTHRSEFIGNDSIVNVRFDIDLDAFQIMVFGDLRRRFPGVTTRLETIETRRTIRNFRIQREVIQKETTGTFAGTPKIEYIKITSRRKIENFRIQREVISREIISSTGPTREEEAEFRREWEENERLRQLEASRISRIFPEGNHLWRPFYLSLKPILEKINYPEQAIKMGLQGRILVRFEVGLEGNIANAKILQSTDQLFTNEVLSAFQAASICGYVFRRFVHREYPRPLSFTIPILFRFAN